MTGCKLWSLFIVKFLPAAGLHAEVSPLSKKQADMLIKTIKETQKESFRLESLSL